MNVSAIVTSRNNREALWNTLSQLSKQRHQPEEVIVAASYERIETEDYNQVGMRYDYDFFWISDDDREDWGHNKRALGLAKAQCNYVAFFNDDDKYSSKYLAKLIEKAEETGADIVACDFASHLVSGAIMITQPKIGHITTGNFIARRELAQRVGYNHRHYEADGQFIEDLMNAGATFARVPEVLYVHQ